LPRREWCPYQQLILQGAGNNASRPLGDGGLDFTGVNLECFRIGIDKDRQCVLKQNNVDSRYKSVWGHNNLIARANLERVYRGQQRRRTAGSCQAIFRAQQLSPGGFELMRKVAVQTIPFPGHQHLHPSLFVFSLITGQDGKA